MHKTYQTISDKDGFFSISSPAPGMYDMIATHECFENIYRGDIDVSQDADIDLGTLIMKADVSRKGKMDKGVITGIVLDQKFEPLPGAKVTIRSS